MYTIEDFNIIDSSGGGGVILNQPGPFGENSAIRIVGNTTDKIESFLTPINGIVLPYDCTMTFWIKFNLPEFTENSLGNGVETNAGKYNMLCSTIGDNNSYFDFSITDQGDYFGHHYRIVYNFRSSSSPYSASQTIIENNFYDWHYIVIQSQGWKSMDYYSPSSTKRYTFVDGEEKSNYSYMPQCLAFVTNQNPNWRFGSYNRLSDYVIDDFCIIEGNEVDNLSVPTCSNASLYDTFLFLSSTGDPNRISGSLPVIKSTDNILKIY